MDFEEKTITEKTSYVKGLAEGLSLGDTAQDKLIKALIDLVDDMAVEIADLQEELDDLYDELDELEEQVDAVDEDLGEVEDFIWDDEDFDDWDEDGEDYEDCFDITCPSCGEEFSVDENTLIEGSVNCPKCNELLTFDFDEDDEEDDKD
ncbi:MAG: hypothetical protein IJ050_11690 [Clostridia bacterium]|nr:hypothetical protein [Clostridia bacterium]